MWIFKKIKTLYKSLSIDIETEIEKINRKCEFQLSQTQVLSTRETIYNERIHALAKFGRKSLGIASETTPHCTRANACHSRMEFL